MEVHKQSQVLRYHVRMDDIDHALNEIKILVQGLASQVSKKPTLTIDQKVRCFCLSMTSRQFIPLQADVISRKTMVIEAERVDYGFADEAMVRAPSKFKPHSYKNSPFRDA